MIPYQSLSRDQKQELWWEYQSKPCAKTMRTWYKFLESKGYASD